MLGPLSSVHVRGQSAPRHFLHNYYPELVYEIDVTNLRGAVAFATESVEVVRRLRI